jgi:hypothetical protein
MFPSLIDLRLIIYRLIIYIQNGRLADSELIYIQQGDLYQSKKGKPQ